MAVDRFTIKSLIDNLHQRMITSETEIIFQKPSSWRKAVYSMCQKEFYFEFRKRKTFKERYENQIKYQRESQAGKWVRVIDNLIGREFLDYTMERRIRLICLKLEGRFTEELKKNIPKKLNLKRYIQTVNERSIEDESFSIAIK